MEGGCWKGKHSGKIWVGCSGWILRFSCVDSLEYHSNMIADAVKKVIKVGKVSSEGSQGPSTIC